MPERRPGKFTMLVTDDKNLVLVTRRWRSKWWMACCTCGRRGRRKDGTCKHLRALLEDPNVRPEVKPRLKLDPLPMRERNEVNRDG